VPRFLRSVIALSTILLVSQGFSHEAGVVHTPAVDIGYETFGARGDAVPVIAVNGGPDLTPKPAEFQAFPTLVLSGRYDMNVAPDSRRQNRLLRA
jgi:hypothetical protein